MDIQALSSRAGGTSTSSGKSYSPEQDRLLIMLRETKKMKWQEMEALFPGKSSTALRLHYAKLSKSIQK